MTARPAARRVMAGLAARLALGPRPGPAAAQTRDRAEFHDAHFHLTPGKGRTSGTCSTRRGRPGPGAGPERDCFQPFDEARRRVRAWERARVP
jgi:hypothetical protein